MDITVYLPDELGQWAKQAEVNLSATLRRSIEHERARREAAGDPKAHELHMDGGYTIRLHARELAWDGRNEWLYQTKDGRVLVYSGDAEVLYGFAEDEEDPGITYVDDVGLNAWRHGSPPDFFVALLEALGEDATIDIGW